MPKRNSGYAEGRKRIREKIKISASDFRSDEGRAQVRALNVAAVRLFIELH